MRFSFLPFSQSPRRGFTLIELLTVIAIIGILAAIVIPVVGKVRASARQAQCASNLRQVAMAARMYAQENRNLLPPSYSDSGSVATWRKALEPYLNIGNDVIGSGTKLRETSVLVCPAFEPAVANSTSYGLNVYMFKGMSYSHRWSYRLSAVQAPSQTFMIGEKNGNTEQVSPESATSLVYPQLRHSDGSNWAFIDAHVEYVKGQVPADDPRWNWWP